MSQKIRQEQILNILEKRGYVTVKYLVDTLHYSSATINRDLNQMQLLGLVKRTYGGVEAAKRGHLPALSQRQFYMKKEMSKINSKLIREWHPEKNGSLSPNDFSAGSQCAVGYGSDAIRRRLCGQ